MSVEEEDVEQELIGPQLLLYFQIDQVEANMSARTNFEANLLKKTVAEGGRRITGTFKASTICLFQLSKRDCCPRKPLRLWCL